MLGTERLNDGVLTRYLLGMLPEEEAERVDEMSITDDEVAWRLRALENDLVDLYVRGEISGDRLDSFRSSYLTTPQRREKVAMANALLAHERREHPQAVAVSIAKGPWWAWAAAAALLVGAIGLATYERRPEKTTQMPPGSTAIARTATPPRPVQAAPPSTLPVVAVSLLLHAPTRGAGSIVTLDLPRTAERINLVLEVEGDDFPLYRGTLRDLAKDRVVWQSDGVQPTREDRRVHVAFDVPRTALLQGNYSVELTGLPSTGGAELIGSYPFRVQTK